VLRDPIHLVLQLPRLDRLLPVLLQQLRVDEVILDFLFEFRCRHDFVERGFRSRIFFRPNPMLPINLFNCTLSRDSIRKAQTSSLGRRWTKQREQGRDKNH
jgi:hypothetical protein